MTKEEFYGAEYAHLLQAQWILESYARQLQSECQSNDLQPVVYFCSRIKTPESMMEKLQKNHFPVTRESALSTVFDAVGLRIVCPFASDVFYIIERLEGIGELTVIRKKDYLSYPKPNGYRSIHLCVRVRTPNVLAEIQVRTIAMDCWATLEHQLKYKKSVANENLIANELRRCAGEIASVDISMQTIRDILQNC